MTATFVSLFVLGLAALLYVSFMTLLLTGGVLVKIKNNFQKKGR